MKAKECRDGSPGVVDSCGGSTSVHYSTAYVEAQRLYHAYGWSIIPVDPVTKHACVPWRGYQSKRVTPSTLQRWGIYEAFAVITGRLSGVVVLDVDPGGEHALKGLHLPLTAISSTPRGGYHYYFKYPADLTLKTGSHIFGKGSAVDIRAEGGYAVLPGAPGRQWVVGP